MKYLSAFATLVLAAASQSCSDTTNKTPASYIQEVTVEEYACTCNSSWSCSGGTPPRGNVSSEGVISSRVSEGDAKLLCDRNLNGQIASFCSGNTIDYFNKRYECQTTLVRVPSGGSGGGTSPSNPFTDADFVAITAAYSIQKTEVTQEQWTKVMGYNRSKFSSQDKCPSDYKVMAGKSGGVPVCPNNPVETVSWDLVKIFLRELKTASAGNGFTYRLPSDSEWATAADNYSDPGAWCGSNSGGQTHPVGSRANPPRTFNRFGLYDTTGNVWEWTGTAIGSNRVILGGGWGNSYCSPGDRFDYSPSSSGSSIGFRLVRTSP